jgi:HNH endonuclease
MDKPTKYQRWYETLCAKARSRDIPTAYTEVHHIVPRSLGGSDDDSNLVRLTYREHYIAHWLLTKFHTGINLHKMQRALWAMTLKASGERITAGWQVETAKSAIRDMELNEVVDEAWRERWRQRERDKVRREFLRSEEERIAESARLFQMIPVGRREKFLRDLWAVNPNLVLELSDFIT